MPGARVSVQIPYEQDVEKLTVSVAKSYGIQFLNRDGSARDLTNDTLSVTAKLDTTAKTLTLAADANQTTTGKGKATLTIPAAQIAAAGTLYVDIHLQKSGGAVEIMKRLQWAVVASETA